MGANKRDGFWMRCFKQGCLSFGLSCSATLCSGATAQKWYTTHGGAYMWLYLLCYFVVYALFIYLGLEFARVYKSFEYKSIVANIWGQKRGTFGGNLVVAIMALYYIVAMMVMSGMNIALSAQLIARLFNGSTIVFWIASILTAFIFVLLTIKGTWLLRDSALVMTIVMVITLGILFVSNTVQHGGDLLAVLFSAHREWDPESPLHHIWRQFLANGIGFATGIALANTAVDYEGEKDSRVTAVISGLCGVFLNLLTSMLVLPHLPELAGTDDITLLIAETELGAPTFYVAVYYILAYFSIISSGPALTYSVANGYSEWLPKTWSTEKRLWITGLALNILAVIISKTPMLTFAGKLMAYCGQFILCFIGIPVVFSFVTGRVHRQRKKTEGAAVSAASENK